jgi:hemin uptake protein HemP
MNAMAKPVSGPVSDALATHQADELTQGGSLARIVLNDQVYSLRITRAGKLILTK